MYMDMSYVYSLKTFIFNVFVSNIEYSQRSVSLLKYLGKLMLLCTYKYKSTLSILEVLNGLMVS